MNASKSSLPGSRAMLISIIGALSSSSIIVNPDRRKNGLQHAINPHDPNTSPANPLKSLPMPQRALLCALHVLLPTGVLLQSLDLLDRGLVAKIIQKNPPEEQSASKEVEKEKIVPPHPHELLEKSKCGESTGQAHAHAPNEQNLGRTWTISDRGLGLGQTRMGKASNAVYQVRSSQTPKARFKDVKFLDKGILTYTVRLNSWNCSCAAFVFESFPGYSVLSDPKPWLDFEFVQGMGQRAALDSEDGRWEFCGLGFNGVGLSAEEQYDGKVPVCKHLLACLLAERWKVLGEYVTEKSMGWEEMAGCAGET